MAVVVAGLAPKRPVPVAAGAPNVVVVPAGLAPNALVVLPNKPPDDGAGAAGAPNPPVEPNVPVLAMRYEMVGSQRRSG